MVTPMQQPQEGEVRRNRRTGATATYRGGQWYEESAPAQSAPQGQPGIPGFVPMETPADRRAAQTAERADQRLSLAEETAARQARAEERRVAMEGQTQGRQNIQSETDLRKEFLQRRPVMEYDTIATAYRNIRSTAANASAAGDISLLIAYMKMLDPDSVVRETEFATAQNAASVPDRIRNVYNNVLRGERLNPGQRQDFINQAGGIFDGATEAYNRQAERYRGLAEAYGYVPDQVAEIATPDAPATSDQAAPTPSIEGTGPAEQITGRVQQYEGAPYQPTFSGPGSTHENPFVLQQVEPNSEADYDQRRALYALPRGAFIARDGQVFRMTAEAYPTEGGAVDPTLGGVNLRETNMGDNARALGMAAMEQIPFGDEAVQAAAGAISGRGYSDVRDSWQAAADIDNQASRGYRIAGGIGGAALTMAAPGGGVAGKFLAAAPKGAAVARGMMVGGGTGALYGGGAADGGAQERLAGARDGALVGAMTGGALAGGGRRIGEMASTTPPQAGTRAAQVQILRDNGVPLTPGQSMGGVVGTVENLAQRAPILGPAIRGARERGVEGLNRAVGNRALDNIGEGVPANIPAGGDMVGYVRDRLGAEFDRAYSMVPQINPNDPDLLAGMTRIGQRKADLPAAMQQQFDGIVSERLSRLQGATTGQNVGAVRSELNTLASGYLRSQDPAQQALGGMIAELGDELDGAISRASPEAGQILSQAREGYSDYVRLERASTNAGGRPFSPGQLESAVKASDGSVRRGAVGRGDARMQDLSAAARSIMPDQFGNPGTADAVGLGGLGVGMVTEPVTTTAIAGGLTAAATPYFMLARRAVDRLPAAASRREVDAVVGELEQLAAKDPNVIVLRDEILRRTAQTSGVAGGMTGSPPPAPRVTMTGGR
jgi:hypothetical protein